METYSIFWLDASVWNKENVEAQKHLRSIINHLRIFTDSNAFITRVRQICEGDFTILIVSGSLGRIVVPLIHELEQVLSIYVYCYDKLKYEAWSKRYSKVFT